MTGELTVKNYDCQKEQWCLTYYIGNFCLCVLTCISTISTYYETKRNSTRIILNSVTMEIWTISQQKETICATVNQHLALCQWKMMGHKGKYTLYNVLWYAKRHLRQYPTTENIKLIVLADV